MIVGGFVGGLPLLFLAIFDSLLFGFIAALMIFLVFPLLFSNQYEIAQDDNVK